MLDTTIELNLGDPYDISFQYLLNSYHSDLLFHPKLIEQLEFAKGREIIWYFIELACLCSRILGIVS